MKGLMSLKQVCILVLTIVCAISTSQAQIKLGVEAGANYSQIFFRYDKQMPDSLKTLKSYQPKIGFKGGVTFENDFNQWLAIKTGVLYSLRGATKAVVQTNGERRDIVQHLLIFPVLLTVKPIEKLHVSLGVENGFVLANNRYEQPARSALDFRLRMAGGLTYQLMPNLGINLYCSYSLGPENPIYYTDNQGNPLGTQSETMLVASLGLNYTFKAWNKSGGE